LRASGIVFVWVFETTGEAGLAVAWGSCTRR
jgi:hypothetical protein